MNLEANLQLLQLTLPDAQPPAFSNDILIFGDGLINAFDPDTGQLLGSLKGGNGNLIGNPDLRSMIFGAGKAGDANGGGILGTQRNNCWGAAFRCIRHGGEPVSAVLIGVPSDGIRPLNNHWTFSNRSVRMPKHHNARSSRQTNAVGLSLRRD